MSIIRFSTFPATVPFSLFLILIFSAEVAAQPERYYQEKWCGEQGGVMEYVLSDRTRVDCLTETHAVEFDFGRKWAESIGQSLYYSFQTGKRAGIVLILEQERDRRYWLRLNSVINHYNLPIDAWVTAQ